MIVKKTAGCIIQRSAAYILAKGLMDIFIPKTTDSNRWKHWKATIDFKTCTDCMNHQGRRKRCGLYTLCTGKTS